MDVAPRATLRCKRRRACLAVGPNTSDQHFGNELRVDGRIEYLNTDLDLRSSEDLSPIADVFKSHGVFALHVTHADDGLWYAIFETKDSFEEPDPNIVKMLDAIESLKRTQRTIWSRCDFREFNIGYDCGDEPWSFNQGLSNETLSRIAAVGATLRWTLYPDRPATEGKSKKRKPLKSKPPSQRKKRR